MSLGNAVMHVAESLKKRLLKHHEINFSQEWILLRENCRKESTRIAGELHGALLQAFVSGSWQLCLADERVPADWPAKPMLRRALDLVRRGLNEGRATLLGLRSPAFADGSLERALCDVRNDFASNEHPGFRIVIVGNTKSLQPEVRQQIFLIVREALLNAWRHSEASSVEVEIECLRRTLRVLVRDNGKGIDPRALQPGQYAHRGLTSIREKTASIGGEIRVWSKQGQGTDVEISVPIRGVRV